jgi:hypothetical protein
MDQSLLWSHPACQNQVREPHAIGDLDRGPSEWYEVGGSPLPMQTMELFDLLPEGMWEVFVLGFSLMWFSGHIVWPIEHCLC